MDATTVETAILTVANLRERLRQAPDLGGAAKTIRLFGVPVRIWVSQTGAVTVEYPTEDYPSLEEAKAFATWAERVSAILGSVSLQEEAKPC